ncbi:MAG: GDP-L-fucose synthase [Verrucomicrobia bacterium]|nr:GDP-L-fucose synthase [Verrucomicrobiota bacterium]
MVGFWDDKTVIVTGGSGFLGSYVVDKLQARGCRQIIVPRSQEFDLTQATAIERLYGDNPADMVIHLAAVVGGIGANREKPGTFFYQNMMMGVQLMEQARLRKIPKFVAIGTICAYPKFTPVPFKEEALWDGYPEETNAPYGLAKKMMLVQAQAYRQEFGYNAIYLLPVNLFGPRDNFDPSSSHVIPALIRKCLEARDAKADHINVWGDGSASREFLYAQDAAEGILLSAERYDGSEPVNLGAGQEILIRDLVSTVARLTRFQGDIRYDTSKPNGQPRRCLDTTRARELFGFQAQTSFEDGLRQTIDWYESVRADHPNGHITHD